jgi:hypothetical protein
MSAYWLTASLLLGAVQVMPPVLGLLPISGADSDYHDLIARIGAARFVLLGESSHGTSDFYRERSRISQRLIRDGAVGAVIIEADATEVERANRYVRGLGQDETAAQALSDVIRFPRWMWRNVEFRDFLEALRTENRGRPTARRVGVYGMDVMISTVLSVGSKRTPGVTCQVWCPQLALPRRVLRLIGAPEAYGVAARKTSRSCEGRAAALLAAVKEAGPGRGRSRGRAVRRRAAGRRSSCRRSLLPRGLCRLLFLEHARAQHSRRRACSCGACRS